MNKKLVFIAVVISVIFTSCPEPEVIYNTEPTGPAAPTFSISDLYGNWSTRLGENLTISQNALVISRSNVGFQNYSVLFSIIDWGQVSTVNSIPGFESGRSHQRVTVIGTTKVTQGNIGYTTIFDGLPSAGGSWDRSTITIYYRIENGRKRVMLIFNGGGFLDGLYQ